MTWDRFDICEAWYIFATEYHREEYGIFARLQRMHFRPSPLLSKESLTENGRCILANLIRKYRREGM